MAAPSIGLAETPVSIALVVVVFLKVRVSEGYAVKFTDFKCVAQ